MPVPKRWFPCNRDVNDDPEVWELTKLHGVTGLRMFLEVMSIIDKTENCWQLGGDYVAGLAHKVGSHRKKVEHILEFMEQKNWIVIKVLPGNYQIYTAPNYWKYHKRREPKTDGPGSSPILSDPSLSDPSLSVPNHQEKKEIQDPDSPSPNNGNTGPRRGSPPSRKSEESIEEYIRQLGERMTRPRGEWK